MKYPDFTNDIVNSIVRIGNRAKDNTNYCIANMCFAVLVTYAVNLKVIYENSNRDFSSYYDLVSVGSCGGKRMLGIPTPYLNKETIIKLLKSTSNENYLERMEHNRQTKPFSADKSRSLLRKLFQIVSPAMIILAINERFEKPNEFIVKLLTDPIWATEFLLHTKRCVKEKCKVHVYEKCYGNCDNCEFYSEPEVVPVAKRIVHKKIFLIEE